MKKVFTLITFVLVAIWSHAWDYNEKMGWTIIDNRSFLLDEMYWTGTDSWKTTVCTSATSKRADVVNARLIIDTRNQKLMYFKDAIYNRLGSKVTMKGLFIGKTRSKSTPDNVTDLYDKAYVSIGRYSCYYIKSIKVYYTPLDNSKVRLTSGQTGRNHTTQLENTYDVENYMLEVTPLIACTHIPLYCDKDEYNSGSELALHTSDTECSGVLVTKIDVEFVLSYESLDNEHSTVADIYNQQKYVEHLAQMNNYSNEAFASHYKNLINGDVNEDGVTNSVDIVSIYNKIATGQSVKNGHQYVDLGLPSGNLWATCNVMANCPEGFGDYVSYSNDTKSYLRGKYIFSLQNYYEHTLEKEKYSGWEKNWKIPTADDYQELIDNTTADYDYQNGIRGCIMTSKINGAKIFFPFAGVIHESGYSNDDILSDGVFFTSYHTCTLNAENSISILSFAPDNPKIGTASSYYGHPLRMVWKP